MKTPTKLFPLIVTEKLAETKKFYTEQAAFQIVIEAEGYLQVRLGGSEEAPELCFMTPDAMPEGPRFEPFSGKGLIVSVPTNNADEKARELRAAGVAKVPDPVNKPWGWRSFLVPDPNGMLLDFFHPIEAPPTKTQN